MHIYKKYTIADMQKLSQLLFVIAISLIYLLIHSSIHVLYAYDLYLNKYTLITHVQVLFTNRGVSSKKFGDLHLWSSCTKKNVHNNIYIVLKSIYAASLPFILGKF